MTVFIEEVQVYKVDRSKCTGCGDCTEVCPTEAINLIGEKAVIDEDDCAECGQCADEYANDAIYEEQRRFGGFIAVRADKT